MTFLLQAFFHKPWGEREKRLAELIAQNEAYKLMLDLSRKVGEAAGGAESVERGLQASVETLRQELKLDGCSLRSYHAETEDLRPVVGCGYRANGSSPMPLSAKTGIAGKAIRERRPIFVENPDEEKEFVKPTGAAAPVRSLFCVPLAEHGEVIGVLSGSSREPRNFTAHEREILEIIAARLTSLLRIHRGFEPPPAS
jgi:GAF domain-containing protein